MAPVQWLNPSVSEAIKRKASKLKSMVSLLKRRQENTPVVTVQTLVRGCKDINAAFMAGQFYLKKSFRESLIGINNDSKNSLKFVVSQKRGEITEKEAEKISSGYPDYHQAFLETFCAIHFGIQIPAQLTLKNIDEYIQLLRDIGKYRVDFLESLMKQLKLKAMLLRFRSEKMALRSSGQSNKKLKSLRKIVKKRKPSRHMEDRTLIKIISDNEIVVVNSGRVITVNHLNYVKESDVNLPYDNCQFEKMPPLHPPTVTNCHAASCRLGCVCWSLMGRKPASKHCAKPDCMIECSCLLTNKRIPRTRKKRLLR